MELQVREGEVERRSEELQRGAERLHSAEAHTRYEKSQTLKSIPKTVRQIAIPDPLERGGERLRAAEAHNRSLLSRAELSWGVLVELKWLIGSTQQIC